MHAHAHARTVTSQVEDEWQAGEGRCEGETMQNNVGFVKC